MNIIKTQNRRWEDGDVYMLALLAITCFVLFLVGCYKLTDSWWGVYCGFFVAGLIGTKNIAL